MAYRHILVPTDGSAPSRKAIALAVRLAAAFGARISGLYVVAEGVPTAFTGRKLYGSGVLSRDVRRRVREEAAQVLGQVERQAAAAGVACRCVRRLARDPWRAILRFARASRCDLIVMGSHGRGSLPTVLLGSQTTKVLAHSRIHVLVCR